MLRECIDINTNIKSHKVEKKYSLSLHYMNAMISSSRFYVLRRVRIVIKIDLTLCDVFEFTERRGSQAHSKKEIELS